ncbi:EAL domain-containing protein [Hoeflea sp. TYP-13]|uniref:EAL domain-containing protein n=1 Tax=Hoeflea sp. TYP-13 TaxID=3230023 RepID=UPI0034C6C44E
MLPRAGFARKISLFVAVLASTVLFSFVTASVVHSLRESQNRERLQELAASTLHRAELGADYAFIALTELSERSDIVCGQNTIELFRKQIHQRAIVKDIRIVDAQGITQCAAFPDVLGADQKHLDMTALQSSRNDHIKFMPLTLNGQPALGVHWTIDTDRGLVAIVNTDTLVFDVLPSALRTGNEVRVMLTDGALIASHAGGNPGAQSCADHMAEPQVFSAASRRYPLRAQICIDRQLVAMWNNQVSAAYPVGGGLLGLIFGLLAVRAVTGHRSLTSEIDDALAGREFKAYAQPIFCLKSGEITGCEILARRVLRDGTVILPGDFIPLAERTGRIAPITWQIMDDALNQLRPLLRSNKRFTVAFNICAHHMMQPSFTADLRAHVSGSRVGSRQVVIELTERHEISDFDQASATIAELKKIGYRVAIDDAGTGHSGLSYIQKLGADTIKIDKFFVDPVIDDPSARSLINMLVRLAHDLGMSTVAEGIETREQAVALAELGVERGQGYLVSRPLPLDAFLRFVAERDNGHRRSAA